MGGTGADPFPRDLSVLTSRERQVYDWACREWSEGRYPSKGGIGRLLGVYPTQASRVRRRVIDKVGWPCPLKSCPFRRVHSPGLTPLQRRAYEWAVQEHVLGHCPGDPELAAFLGVCVGRAQVIRSTVTRKVGWPFRIRSRPSGTHGLTPLQRSVLLDAIALWEGGEYPSIRTLSRLAGSIDRDLSSVIRTRQMCVTKGIWPCKIKRVCPLLTDDQKAFLLELRRQGIIHAEIPVRFAARYGRRISSRTVQRIFKSSGVTKPHRSRTRDPVPVVKDRVIAARGGLAPRKLEEPAAYRRACRTRPR